MILPFGRNFGRLAVVNRGTLFRQGEEAGPEGFGAGFGVGGDGEDFVDFVFAFEVCEAFSEGVVGETVGLGADDKVGLSGRLEEID